MREQKGFAVVELLIIILILAVVGFGGYYVWHTNHKAAPQNTSANLTLQGAVNATKTTYTSLTNKWSSETEVSLINNDPDWFTAGFIKDADSAASTNEGLPLVCGGNGVTLPDSVQYSGVSAQSNQAIVKVTFVYTGTNDGSNGSWLVTLVGQSNKWLISGLTCPT